MMDDKLDKIFRIMWDDYDNGMSDDAAPDYTAKAKSAIKALIVERETKAMAKIESNIGILRQLLNEDFIKDGERFITNEQLRLVLLDKTLNREKEAGRE